MAKKGSVPSSLAMNWAKGMWPARHWAGMTVLLVILTLGAMFRWAAQHEWGARMFPVRHVSVTGAHYLDRHQLQRQLAPLLRGGFFSAEPAVARESIRGLPWVADVMVRRVWPDQVVVAIRERVPFARWNRSSLLSAAGDVFTPDNPPALPGLPSFVGPAGSQMRMLACYEALTKTLSPLGTTIVSLKLTPLLSWEMVLENGIRVHLGSQDILTHLSHFVKVYASVVGSRAAKVDYVDLRYPDGFAVRWKKQV